MRSPSHTLAPTIGHLKRQWMHWSSSTPWRGHDREHALATLVLLLHVLGVRPRTIVMHMIILDQRYSMPALVTEHRR